MRHDGNGATNFEGRREETESGDLGSIGVVSACKTQGDSGLRLTFDGNARRRMEKSVGGWAFGFETGEGMES